MWTIREVNVVTGEATDRPMTPEEIADAQARTLAENNPKIDALIDAKERAVMLPRVTREYLLTDFLAKATAAGYTEAQLYATSPAYKKVKDFNAEIQTLRAQRV